MIRELVPDIRVRFAHGQMSGSKLEKIIRDFYLNKFDVLVSTNIVENGMTVKPKSLLLLNHTPRQYAYTGSQETVDCT